MIKCSKCGAELSDDTKFCSYCGNKIEATTPPPIIEEDSQVESNPHSSSSQMGEDEPAPSSRVNTKKDTEPKSLIDKIKAKGIEFWDKRSVYGKVVTVAMAVFVILALIAFASGKTAASIISILQIVLVVVSILMHKGVVKQETQKSWAKYLVLVVAFLLTVLNIMSYSLGQGNTSNHDAASQPSISAPSDAVDIAALTPVAASDCVGADVSSIQNTFSTAGFTNIKTEKVEDLKSAEADQLDTVESISVNGDAEFTKGHEYKKSDEIVIRYHVYEKCNVTIHVDFISNLIFSTYDVDFLWNGIEKGTLEHGKDQDFELSVDPGEYTIAFESTESSSVEGEVSLNVDCDVEAAYKISCLNDKITVETLYVDRLTELAEGEVKVDISADEYKHQNYKDVEAALQTIGFTNIQYDILYDIVIGWTDEGEVESVSIAGRTDFTRGEVFEQDAPVVITYHMKEEDDPNKPVETAPAESKIATPTPVETEKPTELDESKPNLTVENCPELAAILSNKAEIDDSYSAFALKYKGRIIEFDGRIDNCTNHRSYDTRFDYLISAGDYDPDRQIGPSFKFENVAYHDLNTDLDTVSVGLNVHVIAEVVSFDSNTGLFYLEPVSVTGR